MRRIFIAVTLDEAIHQSLEKTQKWIRPLLTKGRFANPSLFHLTIQFLGELSEDRIHSLVNTQHHWTGDIRPFNLRIERLGCFDKRNKAVLWAGVAENPPLNRLAEEVRESLKLMGFVDPKPFKPHITLVREAVFRGPDARDVFYKQALVIPSCEVDGFHIMESKLENQKRVHRSLKQIFF
ncbi:MAG: RNA 2',3'-cyclic phosphodiesterase [Bacillota bacterium]|nr:RNA 2',3'-cyclic phosphodiesterase [Bacillota bacterium]MDW7676280.1 RNA 2',3'-cyclic phosphodiesterase [Bacillota bacterium]